MLILAAVAINMAINSDGLFGKANEAVDGWNKAVNDERTTLLDYLDIMEETTGGITDIRQEIDGLPAKKTETELSEYIPIYTTEQLKKIATGEALEIKGTTYTMATNAKYALMNDLDFSSVTDMKPIKGFTGIFEGNGCTIKNLNIDVTADAKTYINILGTTELYYPGALFETAIGATIKNLAITDATIKSKESTSALVAQGDNVTIDNCYIKDSNLSSNYSASGCIIGFIGNNGGTISNCKVLSTTLEGTATAGICGISFGDIQISDCQVYGNSDNSVSYYSGIIYHSKKNTDLNNCKIQNISFSAGGIAGVVADGEEKDNCTVNVTNCTAKNTIATNSYNSAILYNSKAGNVNIENCKVETLKVNYSGTGVIAGIIEGAKLKIDKCSIKDITIDEGGVFAGIIATTNKAGEKSITNCNVSNVTCNGNVGYFGGIAHVLSGDFVIENCTVSNLNVKR